MIRPERMPDDMPLPDFVLRDEVVPGRGVVFAVVLPSAPKKGTMAYRCPYCQKIHLTRQRREVWTESACGHPILLVAASRAGLAAELQVLRAWCESRLPRPHVYVRGVN